MYGYQLRWHEWDTAPTGGTDDGTYLSFERDYYILPLFPYYAVSNGRPRVCICDLPAINFVE